MAAATDTNAPTTITQLSNLKDKAGTYLIENGPKLLGAIVVLVAGFIVARFICRLLQRWLEHRHLEPPVRMLFTRVTWLIIMALFFLVAMGTMGIAVGPLIAVLSVAGVGIGLAMQGVLGNLVSGLLIIFTKPFRLGEFIEVGGNYGQVSIIELFSTTLLHPDKSRVIIPNRKIVGEVLHNYGTIQQHDIRIGVSYATNLPQALALIQEVLAKNDKVLKDPVPAVAVGVFGDSAVEILIKPWSKLSEFGPAAGQIKLDVIEALQARRIEIPFPQREVRVIGPASVDS